MSPKNKGKFGKGKSAVEPEDEFVSGMNRLADRIKPHAVGLGLACGAIFLLLAGYFGYQWWQERKDRAATALYEEANEILAAPVVEEGEDDVLPTPEGYEPPLRFASHEERTSAALVVLDKLQKEYGGTSPAVEARLLHASLLMEAGRYEEARDHYRKVARDASNHVAAAQAREGIGYAYEAMAAAAEEDAARQQALADALEAFRAVQPKENGPGRDRALYHEARILALQGQEDEAIALLQEALEKFPQSEYAEPMEVRLAQLEAPPLPDEPAPEPEPEPAPDEAAPDGESASAGGQD